MCSCTNCADRTWRRPIWLVRKSIAFGWTLFKVAARVTVSVRRIVLHLASSYPYESLFRTVAAGLMPAPS